MNETNIKKENNYLVTYENVYQYNNYKILFIILFIILLIIYLLNIFRKLKK